MLGALYERKYNICQNLCKKKVSTISLYVGKPLSFLPGIIETHRHGLDMTHTTQYSLFEYLVYFFHVTLIDIELNSFHLHR